MLRGARPELASYYLCLRVRRGTYWGRSGTRLADGPAGSAERAEFPCRGRAAWRGYRRCARHAGWPCLGVDKSG